MAKDINLIDFTDIEIYNMVRSRELGRFPNSFWGGVDTLKTAKDLTRHLFEKILKWDINEIKNNTIIDTFYDNRLGGMLKQLFNNNLLDALLNAYPELEDWVKEQNNKEKLIVQKKEKKEKEKKIEPEKELIKYTDEELIENLQQKSIQLNRNPVMREMSEPEGHIYTARFGSWGNALIAAELIEDICAEVDNSEEAINKAQKIIKDLAYKLERYPTEEEINNLFSEGEIKIYFKSLSGINNYLNEEYTKEELINILNNKRNKLERNPTNKDIKFPRPIIFIDKFGSWENALKEAGLDV